MQTKYAIRRRRLFQLLILCSAAILTCDLSYAQEQSKFQISPARRSLSDQNNSPAAQSLQDQDSPAALGHNNLRNPAVSPQSLPAFEPIPLPKQQDSSRNSNSIMQKSPEFPAMPPVTSSATQQPKFNPADFDLPPLNRNEQGVNENSLQPARDNSTLTPQTFRQPKFDGNVRTVSANLQEDGRNTARGTQPLGNSNQTQTRQQGSFTPRNQQSLSPNLAGPRNNSLQQGNNGLQQSPPAFSPQPTVQRSATQQPNPSNGLNMNLNSGNANSIQPSSPRVGNNPTIGNNSPQRVIPQTPPATTRPNSTAIKTLMSQYSTDQAIQPLPGEPVAMKQMLEMTAPPNRPAMVSQYWATYRAWCEYVCCSKYSDALGQITPPNNPAEKHLLSTARSMAANELLAAEIELTKAQSRLQKFMPNTENDLILPLPSDNPVVTSYNTHFDYYASRRSLPNNVRNIATSLPTMLQLISQQAQTAQASQTSMDQIRQFTQGGRAPVSEALYAVRMWSDAHKQVVDSVVDYNRSIAVYSMNVMGSGKAVDQLASALVAKPYRSNSVLNPNVRQATLPREFQRGGQQASIPATNFGQPNRQLTPNTNGNFNSGAPTINNGQLPPRSNGNQFNGGSQQFNGSGGSTFPSTPSNFRGGQ